MRFGVLADIHGNFEAFKATLEYMAREKVDAYIFLGDYTGEYPHPEKTIALLRETMSREKCYVLRGNKEEYLESGLGAAHPEWDEYKSIIGMLRYVYERISPEDKEFLAGLPVTDVIHVDGYPDIRICHGSPDQTRGVITEENPGNIDEIREDLIIKGHTHRRKDFTVGSKRIINPGSVGLSLEGTGEAQSMILNAKDGTYYPEYVDITYDLGAEEGAINEEGLMEIAPVWTKMTMKALYGTRISHGRVLSKAMEICEQKNGTANWPEIPEEIMEEAFNFYYG